MRNACGDSWPCEITRETKVARKRTDRERLKERAQGVAWRKDKRVLFGVFFVLEPHQTDER